ncbi:uncharacterized protein znf770 [Alosa pseudoharengus]|uniref:uncharacterized protein znf770 n=1 Tax=Alosa pseudoharengus TaxID=34774 RepID=UPI003F8C23C0
MGQQCPICLKQFAFASRLQRHLLMHEGQKPYSCVLCSRDFCQSADLKRHLETHVNLDPNARTDEGVDLYPPPTATRDMSVQDSHLLESSYDNSSGYFNLSEQPEMTGSITDPWNCYRWNDTEVFTESEKMKEKVFSSPRNPNKQPRQGTVARGRPHQCMVCSKHFGSPYKLRRHQLIHTGERPFKCSLCDKAFTQLSHLKLHSKSHCRRNSVKLPVVVLDHPKSPTQSRSAESYPTHLHGKTAISSPTHADVPEVAKPPGVTLADSSPSEIWEQALAKPSPCEIIQVSEQHLTLQVKASYAYDDIPTLDQATTGKLSDYKGQRSDVSPPKKLSQSISEVEVHSHLDDNQMVSSYVSKPHELLVTGQDERSSKKGSYECQTCFKSFSVPSKLHRHMLSHTGQRPFSCHICAKSFRQLCHLKLHLHTKVCLKQPSKSVKRKVRNIFHNYPKESGSLTTVPKIDAHNDMNDCTTAAQNYSDLDTCVPNFLAVNRVRGKPSNSIEPIPHHSAYHSQYGSKPSDQTSEKSLSDLPETVSLNCRIVHECPVCFKYFSSPSKLKRHCLIHTGQRPFQCYICQRAFRQLVHLKVHYRVHERSGRKTPYLQRQGFKNHHSRASTPQQKAFTCNQCGWKFRHQTHLTVHLQSHKSLVGTTPVSTLIKTSKHQNQMSSEVQKTNEPTKECISGQSVCIGRKNLDNIPCKTQRDSLTSDIRTHKQSPYCCSVCFKCFDCPSRLQRHSLCHSGRRPFKCLLCSKDFRQRAHLKVHRCQSKEETRWSNGQSQSAKYCYPAKGDNVKPVNVIPMEGSSNRDQVDLNASLDFVRGKRYPPVILEPTYVQQKTTVKPTKQQKGHPCTICKRHFSVPSKLARHLLIHMGVKPFTCQVCGRSFRQSCHLQTHLNVHRKRKFSETLSSGENGRQDAASKPDHQFQPQNNSLLKLSTVTKQNTIQSSTPQSHSLERRVSVKEAGYKSEQLFSSKYNQSLAKNGFDFRYVETTSDQWHGNTSSQSHSFHTHEGNGGLFVDREVNYAPEFTPMHPILHRVQNSNADAYPENQIFIDPSNNNTTEPYKHTPFRSERASSPVRMQKPVRKRANRCSICLKKFDSPSKLARHFLIHMGLKPYKCQVCSKSFRQFCHLQTHKKVHDKNTQNLVSGSAVSQPASGDVESASNSFDAVLQQGNPSQSLHFPQIDTSRDKDHHESSQSLISFVNEPGHSELNISDNGFANVSDHKQEANYFMIQPLKQLPSAQNKEDFTDSQQNIARVLPSQLPRQNHDPQEIRQTSTSPAGPTHTVANATLERTGKEQKAEECHSANQFEYFMEKVKVSGDDGLDLAEGSHTPSSYSAQAHLKEEVFELQFEMEGVDSRLSKPPNDLLICPGCSRCFATERKLSSHKCASRQTEELEKPKSGYQCAICFKSFQVPSKLKRHYVIHTGHRPFQCSVCSKTFTQSTHLKTHLHTHK